MNRVTPSWKAHFDRSRLLTVQLKFGPTDDLELVTLDGFTSSGTTRTLRLVPHADGTPVDLLELAIEVIASQMRRTLEGSDPAA
jgi:hypothetical protein